jgi:aryl-alcohol dehydrogenase-like predicted oxidoreductase
MEYRQLGSTDMRVSRLSLGGLFVASLFTGIEEARGTVHRALEAGINFIDTAPGYLNSEEVLGKCLEGVQTPFFLSTKLGGRPQPFQPKDKDGLFYSIEESLRQLKRDYVDILLIHEPDRPGQYDWWDSWDTLHGPVSDVLETLKMRGLIRYTGLGGTTIAPMTRILQKANYDVLLTAFNYSLLFREAGTDLIPAAKKKGMGVIAGSPLQQGWFAMRYKDEISNNPPAWLAPQRAAQFLRLYELSDRIQLSVPELALRFVMSNQEIDTVLTGSRSVQELEANLSSAHAGPLPQAILDELNDIAAAVPFRPFEEPFGCQLRNKEYQGPGMAR